MVIYVYPYYLSATIITISVNITNILFDLHLAISTLVSGLKTTTNLYVTKDKYNQRFSKSNTEADSSVDVETIMS